jgi:hypothetical protein
MTTLIACLSTGKGTWGHVARLIADEGWEKIILIGNEFVKENFKIEKENVELIAVNPMKFLPELVEEIRSKLEGRIKGTEVALNLVSGSGKEHMAVLSALLKLGLGIRLVALTKEGVREI